VMTQRPDLFWGMIASMWIGNLLLVVLNLPLIGIWIRLLTIPYRLLYPAIPAEIELDPVLASGLRVSYDSAYLDTQPFGLHSWSANNIHDPGIVTMDISVAALIDTPYAVTAVAWLDGELDFIVRQPEGGQAWKLRALIAPDTESVHVVSDAVALPEPSSLALVAAALLGITFSGRRRMPSRRMPRCPHSDA